MTYVTEYKDQTMATLGTFADLEILLEENVDLGAVNSMEGQDQEEEDEHEAYDDVKGGLLDTSARQLELE